MENFQLQDSRSIAVAKMTSQPMERRGGEAMELKWGQRVSRAKEMRREKEEKREKKEIEWKERRKKKVDKNSCCAWLCKQ